MIFVTAWVVAPLFGTAQAKGSQKPFAQEGFLDESDLRNTLKLRDALVLFLLTKTSDDSILKGVSEEQALDALVEVGLRLRRADLPVFPKTAVLVTVLLYALCAGFSTYAQATGAPTTSVASETAAPGRETAESAQQDAVVIPPLLPYSAQAHIAQVHEFVLTPGQGALLFRYRAFFSLSPEAKPILKSIVLPLPKGFQNLKIFQADDAIVLADDQGNPLVQKSWPDGLARTQKPHNKDEEAKDSKGFGRFSHVLAAEGVLPAFFGTVVWENPGMTQLPGLVLIVMPEIDSVFKKFFPFANDFFQNTWPARIVDLPAGFISTVQQDRPENPNDPNFELYLKAPPQFTRQMVRKKDDSKEYPSFKVAGIVPSRQPFVVLLIIQGLVFVGAVFFFLNKKFTNLLRS